MTKLLVLALCVCLVMSMSVKERLEKSEATNESVKSQYTRVIECRNSYQGDGECDPACNNVKYNWDGGDCEPKV